MLKFAVGFPLMIVAAIILAKIINPLIERLDETQLPQEKKSK